MIQTDYSEAALIRPEIRELTMLCAATETYTVYDTKEECEHKSFPLSAITRNLIVK